jgi:Tfp pilus assembly protein PilP
VRPKRRKTNSCITCVFALFIGLAFPSGLTGAQSTPETTVNAGKEKPATLQNKGTEGTSERETAQAKAAEQKAREEYFYDPTNKVDPFKSFIIVRKELEEKKKEEEPRTYLETLDLSQLTVTAIVLSKKNKWALVQDSKGEGHVINVGTAIGRKRGKVVKILEREVVVREYDMDYRGNEVVTDISLKLPEVE